MSNNINRILNIGSINFDEVFLVPHFVAPGETIACMKFYRNIGGKGNNQSIALACAGANVFHAGKIGPDAEPVLLALQGRGVDTTKIIQSETPTGKAFIQVQEDGQNSIVLFGGANQKITREDIENFLSGWGVGDSVLFQNEISELPYAIEKAIERGLYIYLNPSPIDKRLVGIDLKRIHCLILNEVEARAISNTSAVDAMVKTLHAAYPLTNIVLTLGSEGVTYMGADGTYIEFPSRNVRVVDTTAAGDTFTGFFIAAELRGEPPEKALEEATIAASLCVSREGASVSIPTREEILNIQSW